MMGFDIVVFYRSGISGGTATLAIRLGTEFVQRGCTVYYLYHEDNNQINAKTMASCGIEPVLAAQNLLLQKAKDLCSKGRIVFIVYTLSEYLVLSNALPSCENYDIYIYHTADCILGIGGTKSRIKKAIKRALYKPLIKELYIRDKILLFNRKCEEEIIEFYKIKQKSNIDYYPIPIKVKAYNEQEIISRYSENPHTIIAIARAEFPFKGYLFGLVDAFSRISENGIDCKLKIITSKSNSEKLVDHINQLAPDTVGKVYIEFDVDYKKVLEEVREAYVNVGMGTTLLDAGSNMVPSLIAKDFSYESVVLGRFGEFGTLAALDSPNLKPMQEELIKFLRMTQDEYIKACKSDYSMVKEEYSLDSFMEHFYQNAQDDPYRPNAWLRTMCSLIK